MRNHEIKIGGFYTANVSGRLTTVRVDAVRTEENPQSSYRIKRDRTFYDVTDLATGLRATFRSAAKFREVATEILLPNGRTDYLPGESN